MANLPSHFRPRSFWNLGESQFRDLSRLQRQIDRMFDEFTTNWPEEAQNLPTSQFAPACDIEETESHYVLSFDLPGLKKEDIRIELVNNELRVSGERKEAHEEKQKSRYRVERFYGNFSRSFTLPQGIKPEQIETHYSEGVLRIAVPKMEAAKAQQIKIGEGKQGFFQKLLGTGKEESKQKIA